MWWSERRRALLRLAVLGAVTLAGCGFSPVYAPGGTGAALDHAVTLVTPQTVEGFSLRQQLQERLGAPLSPRYVLTVEVSTKETRVAVTRDQDTRRYNVLGEARFTLTSAANGQVLTTGTIDSFTSYSAAGTTVATLAAERDAYERLMVVLADNVVDRLYLTLPDTPPAADSTANAPVAGGPQAAGPGR